jgi:hypothetical protein
MIAIKGDEKSYFSFTISQNLMKRYKKIYSKLIIVAKCTVEKFF